MAKNDNTIWWLLGGAAVLFVAVKPKAKPVATLPPGTVVPPVSATNSQASNPISHIVTTVGDLVKNLLNPTPPAGSGGDLIDIDNNYTQDQIDDLADNYTPPSLPTASLVATNYLPPTPTELMYADHYSTGKYMTGYEAEEKYR